MTKIAKMIVYTTMAGACIPLGGLLARIEHIRPDWMEREFRHFIIAFGGGVLLAAVALVLLPVGVEYVQTPWAATFFFCAGGVIFFAVERVIGLHRRESPQFLAMLLDYIPESLALGGMFAIGAEAAPLLAILIGIQNLPEGFNAYRERMSIKGTRSHRLLLAMCVLVPIGPILALLGWRLLSSHTYFMGVVTLAASGGILYLIFQDIAPQSRLKNHWFPPLGAVLGFGTGLLGQLLSGSG